MRDFDPTKVYVSEWVSRGPGYAQVYNEVVGLDPDPVIVTLDLPLGFTRGVMICCGECGVQANTLQLIPEVNLACPGCYTVYRLSVSSAPLAGDNHPGS